MIHTRGVRNRRHFARVWGLLACLAGDAVFGAAQNAVRAKGAAEPEKVLAEWQSAANEAAKQAQDARIVVLDMATGRLLGASHLEEAAHTLASPGSAMKPLALYGMIAGGRWDPARRIFCTRKLKIRGHSLNCSHPAAEPLDARLALTWSCNTYFAEVAKALRPGELRGMLEPTGLLGATGLAAGAPGGIRSGEAIAEFRPPRNADESRLALLGVEGVRVTPLEFAVAYRWLGSQFAAHPGTAASQVVRAGLEDSASFGMAGAANLGGVAIAGKTGTASAYAGGPTHGWFLGLAPARQPSAVIAVYLPSGHGSDAAHVAAALLAHSPLRQK